MVRCLAMTVLAGSQHQAAGACLHSSSAHDWGRHSAPVRWRLAHSVPGSQHAQLAGELEELALRGNRFRGQLEMVRRSRMRV